MNYHYCCNKSIRFDELGIAHEVYGVSLVDGKSHIIKVVEDIFTDYKKAIDFVTMLNHNQLSKIHLNDVISDFI